ncbi:MAG: carbohydrate-binding family 9-like protein [Deltaproteobacteria bacterium]|nr:carbohydrate-binding family 9-like protein [Deltaproteobacteria bacterium]
MLRSKKLLLSLGFPLALAGTGCVEQQDDKPTAEDMTFVKQHLLSAAPSPKIAVNADLDGKVVYLGMDADPVPVEPGKDVKLTHYWKVVSPPGDGWRTFTHASGHNNQGFLNFDHGPIRGKYPVSQWKAGDIIRDEHTIRLPPTWPHPIVEIHVGVWKGNQRLAVKSGPQDGKDRLLAAVLEVKGKQPPIERKYAARKVAKAPKLDGKLDEAAWAEAPSVGVFLNTMTGEPVRQKTDAKLLWDDKYLYIGFESQDDDVWGEFDKRDDKLWQQEAVEIMIDANGDGKTYTEFQVSPKGTVFDTYLPEYRKYEDVIDPKAKPFSWNSGIKAAVKVEGTLNKRDDVDQSWTAEIAIPLADVGGLGKGNDAVKVPPAFGDSWRLNMFRLDLNKSGAQEAQGWSPPLVGDFHKLDRFGTVTFVNEKGDVPAAEVKADKKDDAKPADDKAAKEAEQKAAKSAARAKQIGAALEGMPKAAPKGEEPMKIAPK